MAVYIQLELEMFDYTYHLIGSWAHRESNSSIQKVMRSELINGLMKLVVLKSLMFVVAVRCVNAVIVVEFVVEEGKFSHEGDTCTNQSVTLEGKQTLHVWRETSFSNDSTELLFETKWSDFGIPTRSNTISDPSPQNRPPSWRETHRSSSAWTTSLLLFQNPK